ncbi:polypeptide N-acetylgalactosaminyltransferase 1-like [Biomphalaria glabrata]|uniref:Polypeptide N-acetylgalactosaminyltransferase n=1 Tax=Biomphalaria glabrata TaxID=6526 RepID=A0A9W2Z2U8_BIOGL|nr:polypeptide N-acetylgalactosaminyltransferase 1-like [Biomphalaria glabrata]XP_055869387.1 polypeptide N-acetylgalactosaminyltransferase 1-like [Biomphalaria glabrata]XP_055869388.1 polypeptide N-acetylgalactosaminyltransferase 1-like [Biomphalaria glabrata]
MRLRKIKRFIYLALALITVYNFVQLMRWTENYGESESHLFRLEQSESEVQAGLVIDETFTEDGYPVKSVHGVEVKKSGWNYSDVQLPRFVERGDQWSPGEDGQPFQFVDPSKQKTQEKMNALRDYLFDVTVSDVISVHRRLPDLRSERCQREEYVDVPAASVIIVFHNEAWTTLLRTISSVLDRTPAYQLMEILLIDDASTKEHLKQPLEKYIQSLIKVRLIRTTRRLGISQGRNLGYQYAKGNIIVFMDSHAECLPGWYEPLASTIMTDQKAIAIPVIDTIDPNTFALEKQSESLIGGVHIHSLMFFWLERRHAQVSNNLRIESPTLPGAVFAISKQWFSRLGMFDPYLLIWGGENIEMSFKAWMCGGSLLITTCSHVAHLKRTPQNVDLERALLNSARVAEVWMDQYKQYFHEKSAFKYTQFNHKNIESRIELRNSLECKSFFWFLDVVSPELLREIDTYSLYLGQLTNKAYGVCLEALQNYATPELTQCKALSSQVWMLRTDGRLTCYGSALIGQPGRGSDDMKLMTAPVNTSWTHDISPEHQWDYDMHERLVHKSSGLCLAINIYKTSKLQMMNCISNSKEMKWSFPSRKDFYHLHQQMASSADDEQ